MRKSPTCETRFGFFAPSPTASLPPLLAFAPPVPLEPDGVGADPPGAVATTGVRTAVGLAGDAECGGDTFVSPTLSELP